MFWRITEMPEASQLHQNPPPLILTPSTLGPSSKHNTSRPESLPTNKIISNILLMSQNYIKSLKVDEYTWQRIYFRASIGSKPRHLAPAWLTPRQENAPRYERNFQDSLWDEVVLHGIVSYARYGASCQPLHVFYLLHSFNWVVHD